jgi:hypothetical protein
MDEPESPVRYSESFSDIISPLLTASVSEIAKQLSILHNKKISAVLPDELIDKRWERP